MTDHTQEERDALAHMIMRSLRGNWGHGRKARAGKLEDLAYAGLSDYDSERVARKATEFKHGELRDGRTFRTVYEDGPPLPEQVDISTAKSLVGHIPAGDMTWDASTLDRIYERKSEVGE